MTSFRIPTDAEEWNEAWKQRQTAREDPHGSDFWNERAKSFTNKDTPGSYTEQFLELADIRPGESVFDMGCGTGNLSVPLGSQGHNVVAADFSSVMLDRLRDALREHDITCVHPTLLSWEDDWSEKGIAPNSADVCLASRSIATSDLGAALSKITAVARRRVCITLATGISPRIDDSMLRDIEVQTSPNFDFIYAIAILDARGYLPELRYISTERRDSFNSFDEAYDRYSRMVTAVMRKDSPERRQALGRLREWLDANLVEEDEMMALRHPRQVPWAFISWNKTA